jgi:polysaccharide pyruvyl transferase CsaB
LKILMVTMSMDLGGAETHILELSKELKAKGEDVIVCSNGGVYVDEMVDVGIRHYQAPLHKRSLISALASFFALSKILRTEKPEIVHAHARIPSLLCHYLCKLYRIPFVTTAHYNFATTGILKHLTHWGEKTIAVSQDLKKYLLEEYHLPAENITVTVNGISTVKFAPGKSPKEILNEFSLPENGKYIVSVSRLDKNACKSAEILIDGAYLPCSKDPLLYVIIVGSGNMHELLSAKAAEVNARLGRNAVILTGGRTDISNFTALSTVFVGVSRSALEAMAACKPTILAGNQGYLGLYSKSILDKCIATNFTCRGFAYPSESVVWQDVSAVLYAPESLNTSIETSVREGREIVESAYSVSNMADDALSVYRAALEGKGHYDYVVTGYYGHDNSGDEALLRTVVHNLRKVSPDASICALTSAPLNTEASHQVTAAQRFSLRQVIRLFRRSKVLIFGGGNLIQDITSTKSLIYYLALLRLAKHYKMKTMLYANGIGPVVKAFNRKLCTAALNKCDVITLRDQESLTLLQEIKVATPIIEVTADEVLTMSIPSSDKRSKALTQLSLTGVDYMVVAVRYYKKISKNVFHELATAVNRTASEKNLQIVLLPMHTSTDQEAARELASMLTVSPIIIEGELPLNDIVSVIAGAQLLVGIRLHALIFAACCGIPFAGIAYDPKVLGFLSGFPSCPCYLPDALSGEQMAKDLFSLLEKRSAISSEICSIVSNFRMAAQKNALFARELLLEKNNRTGKGDIK